MAATEPATAPAVPAEPVAPGAVDPVVAVVEAQAPVETLTPEATRKAALAAAQQKSAAVAPNRRQRTPAAPVAPTPAVPAAPAVDVQDGSTAIGVGHLSFDGHRTGGASNEDGTPIDLDAALDYGDGIQTFVTVATRIYETYRLPGSRQTVTRLLYPVGARISRARAETLKATRA